ncbi:MipA/OmpV family protein [Puniceibacterium sediminis]|uniref:Outer membrane protein n=1 Tax=Puniceibacterium sediminis TaxID=1608407 RepID=A0A238Y4R0_9RHOB|nr:MipA/OmpV family protein [Puniceibacterium sediminis]SNR65972.1 outer membrane protein [Puniceibacterium sediminis]
MTLRRVTIALFCLAATPTLAAGPTPAETDPLMMTPAPVVEPRPTLLFSLRGGVKSTPEYFGADKGAVSPDLGFKFHFLRIPGGREIGNIDPWADSTGFNMHGSVGYIGARDPDDYKDLSGMDDVDATVELGGGIGYNMQNFGVFANLRRGFGGHEGWVAEAGADYILHPTDRLRLNMGPRLLWGDDTYTDTYFGVDTSEVAVGRPAYQADGGLVTAGVEFGARYRISDLWGLEGAVSYDVLQNDAAASPLVDGSGDDNQWGVRLGVTRVFQLGF